MDSGFLSLHPSDALEIFSNVDVLWWIAGGWALDLAAGKVTREHIDLDVGIFGYELPALIAGMTSLEFFAALGGKLAPVSSPPDLDANVSSIWVKRPGQPQWLLELMLNEGDREGWVYRRDRRIRVPAGRFLIEAKGLRCLAPEIQLLVKSESLRDRDEIDFAVHGPLLSPAARVWLREALMVCRPGHPWIPQLR